MTPPLGAFNSSGLGGFRSSGLEAWRGASTAGQITFTVEFGGVAITEFYGSWWNAQYSPSNYVEPGPIFTLTINEPSWTWAPTVSATTWRLGRHLFGSGPSITSLTTNPFDSFNWDDGGSPAVFTPQVVRVSDKVITFQHTSARRGITDGMSPPEFAKRYSGQLAHLDDPSLSPDSTGLFWGVSKFSLRDNGSSFPGSFPNVVYAGAEGGTLEVPAPSGLSGPLFGMRCWNALFLSPQYMGLTLTFASSKNVYTQFSANTWSGNLRLFLITVKFDTNAEREAAKERTWRFLDFDTEAVWSWLEDLNNPSPSLVDNELAPGVWWISEAAAVGGTELSLRLATDTASVNFDYHPSVILE